MSLLLSFRMAISRAHSTSAKKRPFQVAIDGPAASGKSTTAKMVAQRLGFDYIDTGAFYRCVTLAALSKGINPSDPTNTDKIASIAEQARIGLETVFPERTTSKSFLLPTTRVYLNSLDVSFEIRTGQVSKHVSAVAAIGAVREAVLDKVRIIGANNDFTDGIAKAKDGLVMDGRDIGTVVLPSADLKIFLVADSQVRAERRLQELIKNGADSVSGELQVEDVRKDLERRDELDRTRKVSPLKKAIDAVELDTSELTIEDQVDIIVSKVQSLRGKHLDDPSQKALKAYLIVELESICEADPGMLADYIIALLKHDKPMPELQPLMLSQLEDFLNEATPAFVETLFSALESKSYLGFAKEEVTSIPTEPAAERETQQREGRSSTSKHHRGDSDHSDNEDRSFKHARRHGDDEDRDSHPRHRDYSPSRPSGEDRYNNSRRVANSQSQSSGSLQSGRSNDLGSNDSDRRAPRQPYQPQHDVRPGFNNNSSFNDHRQQWNNIGNNGSQHPSSRNQFNDRGQWGGRGGRGGGTSSHGYVQDRPKRQRCRDYDEKGFCMRGDLCSYDHGEDRIVVDDIQRAAFEMMPGGSVPPFQMGSNGAPFFTGGSNGNHMSNPEMFEMNMAASGTDSMSLSGRIGPDNFSQGGVDGRSGHDMSSRGGMRGRGSMRGIRGGRGRGGSSHPYNSSGRFGAGGTGGAATKTSLVVEHIPDEFNTIFKVNEFFTQFGSLVNIQLDQPAHKALIQYSTRDEANAAYNSSEVIFGNRFVKVYWQPDDQQGSFGGSAPKPTGQVQPTRSDHQGLAPHHAVPKLPTASVLMTPERAAELASERAAAAAKLEENKKVMMEIQKQKEALIQRQQEEQKLLLQKLFANKTMSQQDKDEILTGLKNVAIEVTKEIPNPLAHAQAQAAAAEAQKQADLQREVERLEKERLDRELEVLGQTPSASGETSSASGAPDKNAEATAALKAKLAALKAQASALGLTEGGVYAGRGRGGAYVPRGRGRGAMNPWTRGGGRGGGPIVSQHRTFKLDNRSSKISVQNVDDVSRAGLKTHFEAFGEIESFSFDDDGASATVHYKNRKDAETALQQGSQFSDAVPLKLGWVSESTAPGAAPTSRPLTSAQPASATADIGASNFDTNEGAGFHESEDEDGERSWKR
ncbi:hypothetical protein CPB97_001388 [Podila verticillata]|nr:hypothetical protein CPB97_001388 [Podila verticillata]